MSYIDKFINDAKLFCVKVSDFVLERSFFLLSPDIIWVVSLNASRVFSAEFTGALTVEHDPYVHINVKGTRR